MELPYVTLQSIVRYCTRIMALQHDTLHSTLLGAHAGKLVHNLVKWRPITAYDISMESSHSGPSENVLACVLQRHHARLHNHFEKIPNATCSGSVMERMQEPQRQIFVPNPHEMFD